LKTSADQEKNEPLANGRRALYFLSESLWTSIGEGGFDPFKVQRIHSTCRQTNKKGITNRALRKSFRCHVWINAGPVGLRGHREEKKNHSCLHVLSFEVVGEKKKRNEKPNEKVFFEVSAFFFGFSF
jgi:hypothetical protein